MNRQINPILKTKILVCLIISILSIYAISLFAFPTTVVESKQEFKIKKELTPNQYKDYVSNLLIKYKIKYPTIVLAQAILETGNFQSKIFKENNNLFGMKLAGNRPSTAIKIKNGHACYENIEQSVIDYALLQASSLNKCSTEEAYFSALENFYSENAEYINKIKEIEKTLK